MANYIYISMGLPVAKNANQSPDSGVETVYITAGLPPNKLADEEAPSATTRYCIACGNSLKTLVVQT